MGYKLQCTKKRLDRIKPSAAVEEAIQLDTYGNVAKQTKLLAEVQWQENNYAAIQSSNMYVDKSGLPLTLRRVK